MKIIQSIVENDETVRTQITLGRKLKEKVEASARVYGESMSEYLGKAVILRMVAESKQNSKLDEIAKSVIGIVDLKVHPEWQNREKVKKWVRKIREEW